MALSAITLGAAIKASILAKCSSAMDNSQLTGLANAIAESVVTAITTDAEVIVGLTTAGLQTTTAPGAPTGPPAPSPIILKVT